MEQDRDVLGAEPGGRGLPRGLLAGALVVVGLIVVTSRPDPPPDPEPERRSSIAATLRIVGEVSTSQSGVLVVPVDVVNEGPDLRIARAQVYAEPVRSDPTASGVTRVASGRTGRVVALVEPDCRLLGPRSGLRFIASLGLQLAVGEEPQREVFADLGAEPFLASHVATLCRATRSPFPPGFLAPGGSGKTASG